jgi:hypothetical protein
MTNYVKKGKIQVAQELYVYKFRSSTRKRIR